MTGDNETNIALLSAGRTINFEIDGLVALKKSLANGLAEPFLKTIETIGNATGRVIVTGVGKSGHIGRKIAATLASTGTPAFFVHAAEASHGDLGMITPDDVILALSWSGKAGELSSILAYSRRFRIPLVGMTSGSESNLGKQADIVLLLPSIEEACPHGLAPTTSSTMQLAMGDLIAIALLECRGFGASDFKVFHPGGNLGANLHFLKDVMHEGDKLPLLSTGALMSEAILLMSEKGFGCAGVVGKNGSLTGVITDGDIRRHLSDDLLKKQVDTVMTANPKTATTDMLVSTATEILNSSGITSLFVVQDNKPVGIIHLHDLLRLGVA